MGCSSSKMVPLLLWTSNRANCFRHSPKGCTFNMVHLKPWSVWNSYISHTTTELCSSFHVWFHWNMFNKIPCRKNVKNTFTNLTITTILLLSQLHVFSGMLCHGECFIDDHSSSLSLSCQLRASHSFSKLYCTRNSNRFHYIRNRYLAG